MCACVRSRAIGTSANKILLIRYDHEIKNNYVCWANLVLNIYRNNRFKICLFLHTRFINCVKKTSKGNYVENCVNGLVLICGNFTM